MFIDPMLLVKRDDPFNDNRYIYEPKIDGHRLILSKEGDQTRLWTRHRTDCTRQYPELRDVPIDGDVILDGEVCRIDASGNVDFEQVMDRFLLKKKDKIDTAAIRQPVTYIVFDILFYNGRDLRGLPLIERRKVLESVLHQNARFSLTAFVEGRGKDLYRIICDRSMEGIVAKRKDSVYVSRRSDDWLKIIRWEYADVYIAGYRKDEFGWLANVEEGGRLRPAGIIELAVPPIHKQAFNRICRQLITGEDKNFVFLDPRIRAKVKFRNWTRNRMLRSPAFVDFIL